MNVYLVKRLGLIGYNQYTAFVCYAKDVDEASAMKPYQGCDEDEYLYHERNQEWPPWVRFSVFWLGWNEYNPESGVIHATYKR